jgi:lipopolysaccharide/colanic/teichoic acid biosynthesis glycosyltransferase
MLKRFVDIAVSSILIVVLSPLILSIVIWMYWKQDLPVLYVSERMKTVDKPFNIYKFRTMRPPQPGESNTGVSGGDKAMRITPLGNALRKFRLDEIPQLLNILRGDMSLVGPRPPLRRYVGSHRALYEMVLRSKPGVTGLASMIYHKHEERLLKEASTPEDTEEIYARRCIPRKAAIDLIYQEQAGVCFDMWILIQTLLKVMR